MYKSIAKEMSSFIEKNPTAFHVVSSISEILIENGYKELLQSQKWSLEPNKNYFVNCNGTSIIAFQVCSDISDLSFNIVASHSDFPTFKIKENAELFVKDKYTSLNTEGYGGMICSTWLDRPLSIAGRVLVKEKDGVIKSKLLKIERDLLNIPSVAIHMNRSVNDGYAFNKQVDLMPMISGKKEEDVLMKLIAEELNIEKEQILGSDLYLYNRQKASIWGQNQEFISSPRLDDQQCVFASLKALLESKNQSTINILACFDNEEVGSITKQGAGSTFLANVMKRICISLGKDEAEYMQALSSSFMISADNAHALHPNHPEHSDATNSVYMNEGVVVKSHAGQKYTSDGMSIAIIKELANMSNIPLQYFANRSDKVGGSTLGNIAMSQVSINAVDIGIAQLAMHSSYETCGIKDTLYMINLMKELYKNRFKEVESGIIIVR